MNASRYQILVRRYLEAYYFYVYDLLKDNGLNPSIKMDVPPMLLGDVWYVIVEIGPQQSN